MTRAASTPIRSKKSLWTRNTDERKQLKGKHLAHWLLLHRNHHAFFACPVVPQRLLILCHSYAVMASSTFFRAFFSSRPCETHPGSAGTSATIQPSSPCSNQTGTIVCDTPTPQT